MKRKPTRKKKTAARAVKTPKPAVKSSRSAAKPKSRSAPKKKAPAPEEKGPSLWERSRSARTALFRYGFPMFLLFGWLGWGGFLAKRYVSHLPQFQVDAEKLFLLDRPEWLTRHAEMRIHRKAFRTHTFSIFDPQLTAKIRSAFEADPWIRKVEAVSKRFPNQVNVRLAIRRPIARVSAGMGYLLLDREAHVLDVIHTDTTMYHDLPWIVGVSKSVPERGQIWESAGIASSLQILDLLALHGLTSLLQIQAIDVRNLNGRVDPSQSEIVLKRPKGVRILWGRPIGTFGEVPVSAKLNKIRSFLRDARHIENIDWNIRFSNGGLIPSRKKTASALHP